MKLAGHALVAAAALASASANGLLRNADRRTQAGSDTIAKIHIGRLNEDETHFIVMSDGTLYGWGSIGDGGVLLGQQGARAATTNTLNNDDDVVGGTDAVNGWAVVAEVDDEKYLDAAAATGTACAIRAAPNDNEVICWGEAFNDGVLGHHDQDDKLGAYSDTTAVDDALESAQDDEADYVGLDRSKIVLGPVPLGLDEGETLLSLKTNSEDSNQMCAETSQGRLKCWGDNNYNSFGVVDDEVDDDTSLGDDEPVNSYGFMELPNGLLTGGWDIGDDGGCGIDTDGTDNTLYCWGDWPLPGDLYDDFDYKPQPVDLGVGFNPIDVAVGDSKRACVLSDAGDVKCWGNCDEGCGYGAGDGDPLVSIYNSNDNVDDRSDDEIADDDDLATLGALPNLTFDLNVGETVVKIEGSTDHTCAVTSAGRLKCWGNNDYGQCGVRDDDEEISDERSVDELPWVNLGAKLVADVSLGEGRTCALFTDSTFTCWGDAYYMLTSDITGAQDDPIQGPWNLVAPPLLNRQKFKLEYPTDGGVVSGVSVATADAYVDGSSITFAITSGDPRFTISSETGAITVPAGTSGVFSLTVTATNAHGSSESQVELAEGRYTRAEVTVPAVQCVTVQANVGTASMHFKTEMASILGVQAEEIRLIAVSVCDQAYDESTILALLGGNRRLVSHEEAHSHANRAAAAKRAKARRGRRYARSGVARMGGTTFARSLTGTGDFVVDFEVTTNAADETAVVTAINDNSDGELAAALNTAESTYFTASTGGSVTSAPTGAPQPFNANPAPPTRVYRRRYSYTYGSSSARRASPAHSRGQGMMTPLDRDEL